MKHVKCSTLYILAYDMGNITLRHFHHAGNLLKLIKWTRSNILYVTYMYDNKLLLITILNEPYLMVHKICLA